MHILSHAIIIQYFPLHHDAMLRNGCVPRCSSNVSAQSKERERQRETDRERERETPVRGAVVFLLHRHHVSLSTYFTHSCVVHLSALLSRCFFSCFICLFLLCQGTFPPLSPAYPGSLPSLRLDTYSWSGSYTSRPHLI